MEGMGFEPASAITRFVTKLKFTLMLDIPKFIGWAELEIILSGIRVKPRVI
jgi:hypothetical protein